MTDRPGQARALARVRWWQAVADAHPAATDLLDAGCEPGLEPGPDVDPDHIVWLVLFADVEWTDRRALMLRAAEWRELFGG